MKKIESMPIVPQQFPVQIAPVQRRLIVIETPEEYNPRVHELIELQIGRHQ